MLIIIIFPAIFLLFKREKPYIILFFILLFSISLRLIVPISDGTNAFILFRDPMYNFQVTEKYISSSSWIMGNETTQAIDLVYTPGLHFFTLSLSQLSSVNLYVLCQFISPVLFTTIIIILIFSVFNRIINSENALIATLIFSISYKFNTFESLYVQESLGLLLFILCLYALIPIKNSRSRSRNQFIIFLLASFSLVITHFISSFIFFITLTVAFITSIFLSRSNPQIRKFVDIKIYLIYFSIFLTWLIFIANHFIFIGKNYSQLFLNTYINMIANPFSQDSIPSSTGINLTLIQSIIAYGGLLLPILLSITAFITLFFKKPNIGPNFRFSQYFLKIFGVITCLLFVIFLLGLRGFAAPDVPYRFISFMFIFLSPLVPLSLPIISSFFKNLYKKNTCKQFRSTNRKLTFNPLLPTVFVLVLMTLSTSLLIPNFTSIVKIDDSSVISAASWVKNNTVNSSVIIGQSLLAEPIAVYSQRDFWREYGKAYLDGVTISDVLYFGGNLSKLSAFFEINHNVDFLLVLDKHFYSNKHYLIYYNNVTDFNNFSIQRIYNFSYLKIVYENSDIAIFNNKYLDDSDFVE